MQNYCYEIEVEGKLGNDWAEWFSGLSISHIQIDPDRSYTVLKGILDTSALYGVLNQIQNVGLTLIAISRVKTS